MPAELPQIPEAGAPGAAQPGAAQQHSPAACNSASVEASPQWPAAPPAAPWSAGSTLGPSQTDEGRQPQSPGASPAAQGQPAVGPWGDGQAAPGASSEAAVAERSKAASLEWAAQVRSPRHPILRLPWHPHTDQSWRTGHLSILAHSAGNLPVGGSLSGYGGRAEQPPQPAGTARASRAAPGHRPAADAKAWEADARLGRVTCMSLGRQGQMSASMPLALLLTSYLSSSAWAGACIAVCELFLGCQLLPGKQGCVALCCVGHCLVHTQTRACSHRLQGRGKGPATYRAHGSGTRSVCGDGPRCVPTMACPQGSRSPQGRRSQPPGQSNDSA